MIFVFGSNLMGVHGKGAALHAKRHHGAIQGVGEGRQGNSYAIPTKYSPYVKMELEYIKEYVNKFIIYSLANPMLDFYLTPIGTGLAGYQHHQIAPMFKGMSSGVQAPVEWLEYLYEDFK